MKTRKLIQLTIAALSFGTVYALPDVYYYFDDLSDPFLAEDAGSNGIKMVILKDSQITDKDPKFGEGSLLIQKGLRSATTGFYSALKKTPEFSSGTKQLTITAWVSLPDDSPLNIMRRANFNEEKKAGEFGFRTTRNQKLAFSVDGKEVVSDVLSQPPYGEWFHVAATFSEGEVKFYLNGEYLSTANLDATEIAEIFDEGSISLGLHGKEGVRFDDVALIGSAALDQNEIREIFNLGLKQYKSSKGR